MTQLVVPNVSGRIGVSQQFQPPARPGILIGYARCSTERQDLTVQREILRGLGVAEDRIYLDHGLTGRNRSRPGLNNALAAVREGDSLVVPKLDRLARSVPDARAIGDSLAARGVRLSLGGSVYDPSDPMGKCFFNILATFAEFEVDLPEWAERDAFAAMPQSMELAAGIVDEASYGIETVKKVRDRAADWARVVGEERLWISPSCGFGRHPARSRPVLRAKMEHMAEAAASF